jgi:hypothetical protein
MSRRPQAPKSIEVPLRPEGYPELGLESRTLSIPRRSNASPQRLSERVAAWEAARRGSKGFSLTGLDRMVLPLAAEAAHVYLALRELFPPVAPSHLALASQRLEDWYGHLKWENQPLALAVTYEDLAPLRELSPWRMSPLAVIDTLEEYDLSDVDEDALHTLAETWETSGVTDVWSSGSIDLSRAVSVVKEYRSLMAMRSKPSRPHASGTPSAVQHVLTPLAYALVHEFGHLTDAELQLLGTDSMEYVYGELSAAVLDLDSAPRPTEYARHLGSYPTSFSMPGRFMGQKARQRQSKERSLSTIAPVLGRYATTNRDELFAEAFVAMFAHQDPVIRRRMQRFRGALKEVGLHTSRRA